MAIERLLTPREAIVWELWGKPGWYSVEIAELLGIELKEFFNIFNDCQRKIRQAFQQQEPHVTDAMSEEITRARGSAREQHRRAEQENDQSDHPRHMDDFDAGFEAGVAWMAMPAEQREVWHATRRTGPNDEGLDFTPDQKREEE